jgi:hypothetical protein
VSSAWGTIVGFGLADLMIRGWSSISLIEILGVIGENCSSCVEAAEAEDGGGLAGSWWRFWAGVSSALFAMRVRSRWCPAAYQRAPSIPSNDRQMITRVSLVRGS